MARGFKMKLEPIEWIDNELVVLDQRLLPNEMIYIKAKTVEDCFHVIRDMNVRGAPLIGFTALYGALLATLESTSQDEFIKYLDYLKTARPTAVNLEFEIGDVRNALDRKFEGFNRDLYYSFILETIAKKWSSLEEGNLKSANYTISDLERRNPKSKFNVMTICNTGKLACGPLGTALGVITTLNNQNKLGNVFCLETRPYLQGSRLTSFELVQEGISHNVVVEGAISHVMKNENIDAIFVGADRIAANGDTANKIGTSTLAIVAKHYNVPFYVVAPTSSFDFNATNSSEINIEYRSEEEILNFSGRRVAPEKSRAYNPSFDVTNSDLITGIVCEKGCYQYPYTSSLKELM